jgi:transposase-like protein/very-short-patch-repair endonuclease
MNNNKYIKNEFKYKNFPKKEELIDLYLNKKYTITFIAKKYNCSTATVFNRLKKYSLKIRTRSESLKGKSYKELMGEEKSLKLKELRREHASNQIVTVKSKKRMSLSAKKRKIHGMSGKKHSIKSKELMSYKSKKVISLWSDDYKNKRVRLLLAGLHRTPNKPEIIIKNLLDFLFPNEYKYVGNKKFFIENFNPDFINCNGQKKIIELFGDYWHNKEEMKERDVRRLETYSKYGYNTLIIWENELKDLNNVSIKVKNFNLIQ